MVLHQTVLFAEDRNPIDKARHLSYFVESECKMQLVIKPKQTYLPNTRIPLSFFKDSDSSTAKKLWIKDRTSEHARWFARGRRWRRHCCMPNASFRLFWTKHKNTQLANHTSFGIYIYEKTSLLVICYTSPFSGIVAVQDNWIISGMHARKANGPMTQRAYWCAIQLYSWQGTPAPFCLSYLAKSTLRIADRFNSCSLQ